MNEKYHKGSIGLEKLLLNKIRCRYESSLLNCSYRNNYRIMRLVRQFTRKTYVVNNKLILYV